MNISKSECPNEWMNEWTNSKIKVNKWMHEYWTNKSRINEYMHEWMDEYKQVRMPEWMNERINAWVNRWMYECWTNKSRMFECMNELMDEWLIALMNKWITKIFLFDYEWMLRKRIHSIHSTYDGIKWKRKKRKKWVIIYKDKFKANTVSDVKNFLSC